MNKNMQLIYCVSVVLCLLQSMLKQYCLFLLICIYNRAFQFSQFPANIQRGNAESLPWNDTIAVNWTNTNLLGYSEDDVKPVNSTDRLSAMYFFKRYACS